MSIEAVVFDLDGVIIDSEMVWHEVRRDFVHGQGGTWTEKDQEAVMGANSREWAEHIRSVSGVALPWETVYAQVVEELRRAYGAHLPLYDGAVETVRALAAHCRLAVASSSPAELIAYVLEAAGLATCFPVRVSSDEVSQAKPAPDVYLEACRRLGVSPRCSAAVEDSANGLRAAAAGGLAVVAIPNPHFPPPAAALEPARLVLGSLRELTWEMVAGLGREGCRG